MLTVEMTSMPAASSSSTSCQRFSFREPGALVWANSSTSTRSGRRRRTASTSISVSALPRCSTVSAGHHLEIADLLGRALPAVRLDEPDDDVGAPLAPPVPLVEHGERLADARRGTEVDAQRAPPGSAGRATSPSVTTPSVSSRREVQLEHVDARVAEDRRAARSVGVLVDEGEHLVDVDAALGGDPGRLQPGVAHRDVRVEPGARRGHGVDGHEHVGAEPVLARGRRRPARRRWRGSRGSSGRGWSRSTRRRRSRRRPPTGGGGSTAATRTAGRSARSRRRRRRAR